MKKLLFFIAGLVLVASAVPAFAETVEGPKIGTDEYCWMLNSGKPLAERHDSYFKEVSTLNPAGCFYRYNAAWHALYDEKVFMQPQNVPYVNDLTSRTMKTTDLWGSKEDLTKKLCTAAPVCSATTVCKDNSNAIAGLYTLRSYISVSKQKLFDQLVQQLR